MRLSPHQVKMARAGLGLTLRDLEERSGITATTLSAFENGKTSPYAETLYAIQEALEAAGAVFSRRDGQLCVCVPDPDHK